MRDDERCALCGKAPADGYAHVGNKRVCHNGWTGDCYTEAQRSGFKPPPALPEGVLTANSEPVYTVVAHEDRVLLPRHARLARRETLDVLFSVRFYAPQSTSATLQLRDRELISTSSEVKIGRIVCNGDVDWVALFLPTQASDSFMSKGEALAFIRDLHELALAKASVTHDLFNILEDRGD